MVTKVNSVNMQRQMVDPSQYYANSYASGVMNGDETFAGMAPIGGAAFLNNDSVFGNDMSCGGGANYGYGGVGGGRGYGPGSETMNMTQEEYLIYQEKMENFQIDKQVRQQKRLAGATFQSTAAEDAISRQIAILQRKIKNNEQDTVMKEYAKLVKTVEEKLTESGAIPPGTPKDQIKAHAEKLYFEATGKSVTDDLTANGDSGFVQGLKEGLCFGIFTNKKNYQDNISDITGEDKNSSSSTWRKVGQFLTGGILAAAVIFGGVKGAKAIKAAHP